MTANHRRQYKGGSGARVIAVTGLAAVGTLGIGLAAAGSRMSRPPWNFGGGPVMLMQLRAHLRMGM
jgi:hypothetical protein